MKLTIEDIENEDQQKKIIENKDSKEDKIYSDNNLELSDLTFKEKIQHHKERYQTIVSDMNKKDKFFYTIRYYKWLFISMVAIILVGVVAGRTIYHATWPTILNIAIVNNRTTLTPTEYISDSFRSYYELDNKNVINVYGDLFVSSTESADEVGTTMNDYQKIGFYNMQDMLDIIICDEEALARYAYSDDTTAIDLALDEGTFKQIESYSVPLTDTTGVKNDGKPYIGAIDITDTNFVKDSEMVFEGKTYLLIPSYNHIQNEKTINFIKMVFELQ